MCGILGDISIEPSYAWAILLTQNNSALRGGKTKFVIFFHKGIRNKKAFANQGQ